MPLEYNAITPDDYPHLANWLAADTWPFHGRPRLEAASVLTACQAGAYLGADVRSYWIRRDGEVVGFIRLFEITDPIPRFDLRIGSRYRGQGIGKAALRWLTDALFSEPGVIRVEGQTRQDNLAMRRVFRACGYLKEAHLRRAWPGPDAQLLDAIGYGITRKDWENGEVSELQWQDEP